MGCDFCVYVGGRGGGDNKSRSLHNFVNNESSREKINNSIFLYVYYNAYFIALLMQVFIACGLSNSKPEDPFRKPKIGMWNIMKKQFNFGISIEMDKLYPLPCSIAQL